MKVKQAYTDTEKRMIEKCENMIEEIRISYIKGLIDSHTGTIQPSYEEIQKMKRNFEENVMVKALRETLLEIHMMSMGGYIYSAENEEDENILKNFLTSTEN